MRVTQVAQVAALDLSLDRLFFKIFAQAVKAA